MIASEYTRRNFAIQAEPFSYSFDFSVDNVTGSGEFGFSNDDGTVKITFSFSNGKIFDNNGVFIFSYTPNEKVKISGNIGASIHNYFINGKPVNFNASRPIGDINYFEVSPTDCEITFDLKIFGKLPDYSIGDFSFLDGSNEGEASITVNSSDLLKFYSIESLSSNYEVLEFPTNFLETGNTIKLERFGVITTAKNESVNLSFETNFGDFERSIPVKFNFGLIEHYNVEADTFDLYTAGDYFYRLHYSIRKGDNISYDFMPFMVKLKSLAGHETKTFSDEFNLLMGKPGQSIGQYVDFFATGRYDNVAGEFTNEADDYKITGEDTLIFIVRKKQEAEGSATLSLEFTGDVAFSASEITSHEI